MELLIVKIGALGDVVMALSMLEAADQTYPGARITWVCGVSAAPLLREFPRINELIVIDDQKLLKGGIFGALSQLIPLWGRLLFRSFDLIATGHSDSRYGLLSLTALGKVRRSFGKDSTGRWPVPGRYHADEYARLIAGVNGPEAKPGVLPGLKLSLKPELSARLEKGKKIVCLAPGGAKNILRDDVLRRWPIENYARLAKGLREAGHQVILTGSASDNWVRVAFQGIDTTDLIGQTSIADLISLYGASDLIITHDSGPLHLAVLSGKPLIALFGPTNPLEKVPKRENVKVLWGGEALACRPCYDGKNYAPCQDNQCLKSVDLQRVQKEAVSLLGV